MSHDWLPEEAENRTEISYPLNNRWYTAKYPQAFHATRTNGVLSMDNNLSLRPAGGLRVNLGAGMAWLRIDRFRGVVYAQTDEMGIDFVVPPPHGNLLRLDRVVIRFDYILNDVFAHYKVGVPGMGSPPLQRDTEAHEIHLYEVVAAAGTLEIRNDMIRDLRLNEAVCGVMRDSVTGIPTQVLYDAWWAWFTRTTETAEGFMLWMAAFRRDNEADFTEWLTDFKARGEDGFSDWFEQFQGSAIAMVNGWYQPWRTQWVADLEAWFADLQALLDGDVAANLATRITQHEARTVGNGGVHGIRYEDGALLVQTADGWIVVGGAVTGFTSLYFNSQAFTAGVFNLRAFTADSFDTVVRTM